MIRSTFYRDEMNRQYVDTFGDEDRNERDDDEDENERDNGDDEASALNAEAGDYQAWSEEYDDAHEEDTAYGDARRCPRHPNVKTSSDDGMFDCECLICENEMEDAADAWDCDPENPNRRQCGGEVNMLAGGMYPWSASCRAATKACDEVIDDEEIPF